MILILALGVSAIVTLAVATLAGALLLTRWLCRRLNRSRGGR